MVRWTAALLLACVMWPCVALAQDKPILAVMQIEDKTRKFRRKELAAVTEVMAARLVASGRFSVVERSRQAEKRKAVVRKLRRKSHDPCYDDKCKIELGRELAADSLLTCRIVGIGKKCTLSCSVVPLDRAVAEKAGLHEFGCSAEGLGDAVKEVVAQLSGKSGSTGSGPQISPAQGSGAHSGIVWVHSFAANLKLAETETTVAQFRGCVRAGSCKEEHFVRSSKKDGCNWGQKDRDNHPMNCVSWYGAEAFCKWAGGHLPTEKEWYAEASNVGSREFPWGNSALSCKKAIWGQRKEVDGCGRNSTWPVCSKPAGDSVSGLCDMSGNVWEWTSTREGLSRIMRGGSWGRNHPDYLRAAQRVKRSPDSWWLGIGFRCAATSAR
jgi:hypothetical protein